MLLFLHGTYETNSSFLPLIRQILDLDDSFSDKFILDTFCLNIPGYDSPDRDFNFGWLEVEMLKFLESKVIAQQELAEKLIFNQTKLPLKDLKSQKVILFGYQAGGAVALEFATKNPELVDSIALLDCGVNFRWNLRSHARQVTFAIKEKLPLQLLQNRLQNTTKLRDKIEYSLLIENNNRQGIFSYQKIQDRYDMHMLFSKLDINSQIKFVKIPILAIVATKGCEVGVTDLKKFEKVLHPKNNLLSQKHKVIALTEDNHTRFDPIKLKFSSDYFFDLANLDQILGSVKTFFNS